MRVNCPESSLPGGHFGETKEIGKTKIDTNFYLGNKIITSLSLCSVWDHEPQ